MKVSFGKIYVINENKELTPSQYHVTRAIEDTYSQMTMSTYDNLINVEEYLKDRKNADIFIKNNKDGSTDLEIRQDAFDPQGESGIVHRGFIPYDIKGKERLRMDYINFELDKDSLSENHWHRAWRKIEKNLNNFMKKCEQYAAKPENEKNIDLAEINERQWEKQLLRRENAILSQINAMESYNLGN